MKGSWWIDEFIQPVIMVTKCQDTEERQREGRKCKNHTEIDKFLASKQFYIFGQKTLVDPKLFLTDDEYKDDWRYKEGLEFAPLESFITTVTSEILKLKSNNQIDEWLEVSY